jgi:hypothetical protein
MVVEVGEKLKENNNNKMFDNWFRKIIWTEILFKSATLNEGIAWSELSLYQ